MPNPQIAKTAKLIMLATTLSLSAFSLNAQAKLTSITTSDGTELVYSSVSDVTWTKDGNLLGTLFATKGFNNVVNAIIAASPTISNTPNFYSPTSNYFLKASDFSSNGQTTWFGAIAYINYLNKINYGGSNQWYLPSVANTSSGFNTRTNGKIKGDELAELYYIELRSTGYLNPSGYIQPDFGIVDRDNSFKNEQLDIYWSSTEYAPNPDGAWLFFNNFGRQFFNIKKLGFYAWAVTPGQVAAVPEPENVALLLAGLGLMAGVVRRKQKSFAKK